MHTLHQCIKASLTSPFVSVSQTYRHQQRDGFLFDTGEAVRRVGSYTFV